MGSKPSQLTKKRQDETDNVAKNRNSVWINLKLLFLRPLHDMAFTLHRPTEDDAFCQFRIHLQDEASFCYYLTSRNSNIQRSSLLEMVYCSKTRATFKGMMDGKHMVITLITTRYNTINVLLRIEDCKPITLIVWQDEVNRLQNMMVS